MRVAIYARVSTEKQSTDMQIQELEAYVKNRGWTVTEIYQDQLSGTTNERPRLSALMQDAKSRKFDHVLVWKLDRFGRSLKHLLNNLAELEAVGVVFISLKDNLDFSTPGGRFQVQILAAVAEFEAAMIRERVRCGIRRHMAAGGKIGRARVIDREKVFLLAAEGLPPGKIAEALGVSRTGIRKILAAS